MRTSTYLLVVSLFLACSSSTASAFGQVEGQRVSQFEKAGFSDFLIDKSGVYHAVFQEYPAIGKPNFIYYSSSSNKGASWSKPITVSNDNTGNGAGYPRILQDGSGKIYAIWKRYGASKAEYPVAEDILDGPGGYSTGTLFYKVLSGGAWSNQVMINEYELTQESWFVTVNAQGNLRVFWTQASPQSIKSKLNLSWYYCDYLRTAVLNGTTVSAYTDLTTPSKPEYQGGYPSAKNGGINLNGYVDNAGKVHLIYEDAPNDIQQIKYFDGKAERIAYTYPKYKQGNTFSHPPKLLIDEKGNDHLVFLPSPATLESEQIWDINLATNQTTVLTSIQESGVSITGFQATQGPRGEMAITFEVYKQSLNAEAYGMFYKNGAWKNVGLTHNASKEKFFTKEFPSIGPYRTYIASLTKYSSKFGSVAYDASGKKSMLITISADWTSGGYSTSSPSLIFLPIDH